MSNLANFLTYLSLTGGFASLVFSLEGHFTFAAWAILLSVLFDGLDGQVARLGPVSSGFGKELDSLADVVSFGIAPAILGYVFIYRRFHLLATLAFFIYLICSVTRLAKYNITAKEAAADYFCGLPTTMSGGALASFILIYRKGADSGDIPPYVPLVFLLMVLWLSFLMVSRLRYLNLDGVKRILGRNTKATVSFLLLVLLLAAWQRKAGITLFSLFLIYLLFSPFMVKRLHSSS